jgi:hypothetical protein
MTHAGQFLRRPVEKKYGKEVKEDVVFQGGFIMLKTTIME